MLFLLTKNILLILCVTELRVVKKRGFSQIKNSKQLKKFNIG